MKAQISNYRQSPRKVRLVASLIKGKEVSIALSELNFLNKKASNIVTKLLNSALANAKENNSLSNESLFIKDLRVDAGPTLKRSRPRARGSAYPINKRTSRILLELGKLSEKGNLKSKTTNSKEIINTKKPDSKLKVLKKPKA